MPCIGNAMHPTSPPSSASNVDSSMKDDRMLQRENPSARKVPTSLVRGDGGVHHIHGGKAGADAHDQRDETAALMPTEDTA
jgi:hypothetical protein